MWRGPFRPSLLSSTQDSGQYKAHGRVRNQGSLNKRNGGWDDSECRICQRLSIRRYHTASRPRGYMTSLPTKRRRSESPQGEPGPHSVKAKMDGQTMFSQLHTATEDVFVDVDDTKIANDIVLDRHVKNELSNLPGDSYNYLDMTAFCYHLAPDNPNVYSNAVTPLASILLPAIFKGNQHSLVARYEDIIKSDLSLVKMLMDAYKNGTYGNIRRIGLCGS